MYILKIIKNINKIYMKHTFTIENAYRFAWEKIKKHWTDLLVIGVLSVLVSFIFGFIIGLVQSMSVHGGEMSAFGMGMSALLNVMSQILSLWLGYNAFKILLKIVDGKTFKISEIFHWEDKSPSKIWNYFFATLFYGLVVLVGLILLIVPGIYFSIKYMYVPYLVIDKELSITDAFKKSADMTSGEMWHLIGFGLVSFAVMMVGLLAFLVGVIPAAMLSYVAYAYVYRKLADGHVNSEHVHVEKVVEEVKEIAA